MPVRPALIPCLRYTDAPAAIDFLCRAFGFAVHMIHVDEANPLIVHHAQLVLDGNMVMLGSHHGGTSDPYGWKSPQDAGGITMCVCAVIDDPDGHAATAEAAGAELVTRPHDNPGYPGRSYDARDPEGHVWNFGNYDPWADA